MPDSDPSVPDIDIDIGFRLVGLVVRLLVLRRRVSGPFALATSFGLEDQVGLHLIADSGIVIDVITLDIGRLFPETYELWAGTETRCGLRIRAFYPDTDTLEALARERGISCFYANKSARTARCSVRKSEPLGRELNGVGTWFTGLRADQSAARTCAIAPGEAERDCRWWWKEEEIHECGLHLKDGRLVRAGA